MKPRSSRTVALLALALLSLARVSSAGRRLEQWGRGAGSIMSANDAVGAIEQAVSSDSFARTYAATQDGYRDADSVVYANDIPDEMWLANPDAFQGGFADAAGRGESSEESQVASEVGDR